MADGGSIAGETVPVHLSFPPDRRHLRLVRLVAASLAADADADVDELDDVRVAADELVAALLAADPDDPSMCDVSLVVADGALTVTGHRSGPARVAELDPIARDLLEVTLDGYRLDAEGDGVSFWFRKSLGGVDPQP